MSRGNDLRFVVVSGFTLAVSVSLVGLFLSHLAMEPQRLGGGWISVDANLKVIALVALVAASLLVIVGWRLGRRPSSRTLTVQVAVPAFLLALGIVGVSLQKASAGYVTNMPSGTPEPVERRVTVVPLLYGMGDDKLDPGQMAALRDAEALLSSCGSAVVTVIGFASSAEFQSSGGGRHSETNELNVELANRRAIIVAEALKREGISVTTHGWKEYLPMARRRRLVDVKDGRLVPSLERLNRRVELVWSEVDCALAETSPESIGMKPAMFGEEVVGSARDVPDH